MPSIEVRDLALEGLREIRVPVREDDRGDFAEVWNARDWREAGLPQAIVQHNRSRSRRGVLRGLHYQLPPAAQSKIIRVTHGAIFDVAVDCRRPSATFGRWLGLTLTASDNRQFLVPEGFAHGFLALEENTIVEYLVSAPYSPAQERSLRFDDPALGIAWPDLGCPLILSDKDRHAPALSGADLFA